MIAAAPSKPMVISAKYPSSCKACGRQVNPGDRVEWVAGDKFVSHVQCTEAGQTLIAAVQASKAQAPKADAVEIPCPEGLEYLPYQTGGIQFAMSCDEGCLLGDPPGLGKTIQAIGDVLREPDGQERPHRLPRELTRQLAA